jgi:DnaJ family protein C protein 19
MGKILLVLAAIGILYLWWQSRGVRARRRLPVMPADEARRLLGVAEGASIEEIRAAHRRLIARVHPDTGGSADLAERVNAARDALVAEMNRTTPRAS